MHHLYIPCSRQAASLLPSPFTPLPFTVTYGANAAWFRLAVPPTNVLTPIERQVLPPELLTARPKRLGF